MGLRGQFPWDIKNYTSLTGLDLSNNVLSGPLLFDIVELVPSLTSFDLSINRFSCEIPKNFVNCSYLNVLKLDQNQLTGEIPPKLGIPGRIKTFGVFNNMLSGVVPYFVDTNVLADCFANNKELSQTP
ncbi:probably inactive leucine-rich repeat receptor-like protein kinase At5g48380 [Quercus robur]|uniref:probably inactive leucine-rich repeat receptor-like protein kinase At5g48380 n=1 Tax=Quercus robur TaxID=38942 RepID=UPI0021618AB4|nr:probably inactive leucine-rich repeat receptor-like protein kinase At5g48380 [Quercus robur]